MEKHNFGFESVKRQDDSFFNALIAGVKRLRSGGDFTTTGIKKSYIMQVIKEYTGLSINLYLEEGYRASCIPARLTANHVFDGYGESQVSKIIDVTKTTLKGTVDSANARVTGVFSDVTSIVRLGVAWFEPGYMTDRMISSVLMHEVGHIFTYYQFMSTIAYGNLVIEQTINNVFLTDSYTDKQVYIKAAEETLGIEPSDSIEDWVDTTRDNLETIMVTRFIRRLKARSDTGYYDVRNSEQLADTFAVKHGAGLDLAKANHKLDKEFGVYGKPNFFVNMLVETASLLNYRARDGISIREIILTMKQPKRYDDPKDRLSFIKFQLIDDLKTLARGDNERRKNIVNDIKDMDTILKSIKVHRTALTFIHESFTSAGKSASKQQQQQKQLEELLYNDLYTQSAKLKTLNQE